jgi:hypothetical protein
MAGIAVGYRHPTKSPGSQTRNNSADSQRTERPVRDAIEAVTLTLEFRP